MPIATFLREVVNTPEGAVFFHCTQGKDRTGLAADFLLSALGVGRDIFVADFDKTNPIGFFLYFCQQNKDPVPNSTTKQEWLAAMRVIKEFLDKTR